MTVLLSAGYIVNVIVIFLVVINECQSDPPNSELMTKIKTVKDRILTGYDKLVRPIKEGSNGTDVRLILGPRQIIEVDETNGLFSLDSFIWLHWNDSRLQWDKADYDGTLALPQDLLWLPDISVYNSHSLTLNPQSEVLVYIMNDGKVWWYPPILTQTSCDAILEATYPYDEVSCSIILGSWAHDGWQINYTYNENAYMGQFVNIHSRWEVIVDKVNVSHNVYTYESDPYYEYVYTIPMKRRPVPEIEATRIPCILVMLLTLSVFWLPPNSSKKILILEFQFLVLSVLIVYVAWSTKFPPGVLFATTFLQSTMYIVVVSFLLQILVISNICSLSGPARPPALAMQLLTGPLGKYACLRCPLDNDLPLDRLQLKEDESTLNTPTAKDDWMLFAAGLDRLFFVLMSISMIAIHHL